MNSNIEEAKNKIDGLIGLFADKGVRLAEKVDTAKIDSRNPANKLNTALAEHYSELCKQLRDIRNLISK